MRARQLSFAERATPRDVIDSRLDIAALASSRAGDDSSRSQAREQARALQQLTESYGLYQHIREMQPASNRRTATLDQIAARMQAGGREVEFDPTDVSSWFHNGDDALRLVALNLMLAQKQSRDLLAVIKTMDRPRSLFEQYYGLLVGQAMLPDLDTWEAGLIRDAVTRARQHRRFRRDGYLMDLSQRVLADIEREA